MSVRRRASVPGGRCSGIGDGRRIAAGAGTSDDDDLGGAAGAGAAAGGVSYGTPAASATAFVEIGWLLWRRGGTGGRRRAHVVQCVASTAFSALQNGQNLTWLPPPLRAALEHDLAADDREVGARVQQRRPGDERAIEHR